MGVFHLRCKGGKNDGSQRYLQHCNFVITKRQHLQKKHKQKMACSVWVFKGRSNGVTSFKIQSPVNCWRQVGASSGPELRIVKTRSQIPLAQNKEETGSNRTPQNPEGSLKTRNLQNPLYVLTGLLGSTKRWTATCVATCNDKDATHDASRVERELAWLGADVKKTLEKREHPFTSGVSVTCCTYQSRLMERCRSAFLRSSVLRRLSLWLRRRARREKLPFPPPARSSRLQQDTRFLSSEWQGTKSDSE